MTTSSSTNKFRYEGNGVTDTFAFTGRIFSASDLVVEIITRADDTLEETLTITTDYTVTINSDESASVVVASGKIPSSLQDILIRRDLSQTQTLDLPTGTVFPAVNVENSLDKLTCLVQDLQEEVDRSITLPSTSSLTNIVLPNAVSSEVIGWNAAADSLTTYAFSEISTSLDAVFTGLAANDLLKYDGTNWVNISEIGTANIEDNAVTLGKMAHRTQGDILYFGTNGAPTALGAGTAGEVLVTNGAGADPSWGSVTFSTLDSAAVGSDTDIANGETEKLPTCEAVKDYVDSEASRFYVSPASGMAANTIYTLSHSLGGVPDRVSYSLRCKTAEFGYAVGDQIKATYSGLFYQNAAQYYGIIFYANTSQVKYRTGASGVHATNLLTGGISTLTPANWEVYVIAEKL